MSVMTRAAPEAPLRVLLIDDDPQERALVQGILSIGGRGRHALDWIPEYDAALAAVDRAEHDVYLIDQNLGHEKSGVDLVREARRRGASAPMILLTGAWDPAVDRAALESGATDYLVKGQFGPEALWRCLRYAVERHRSAAALMHAEKLSAMGLLAAGVAHELNSPLMVLLGTCAELKKKGAKGKDAAEGLKAIEEAGRRCAALVKELLAFSRKEEAPPRVFDLREAVSGALALVEPQARYRKVKLVRELASGPLPLRGRRSQLEQVLLNLANNALDAMPEGGTLTVRSSSDKGARRPAARVEVADTGLGIPPDLQARIFEPFFTTKERGRGTGLGLALAQEIVAKHDGSIEVRSEPGRGTVFSVTLPLDTGRP